jgi:catechol 2,3-dioxygenase-like lactoylglutathione lyase family enzyme
VIGSLQCVVLDCPDATALAAYAAWPQQSHLDIEVPDIERAHEQVTGLGATLLDDSQGWPVFADPAGHPFCLIPGPH